MPVLVDVVITEWINRQIIYEALYVARESGTLPFHFNLQFSHVNLG